MGALTATIACLVAYPGCGSEPPPQPPVPVAKFSLAYERSGGLKPMPQKLVVRPGRHATATYTDPGSAEPRTVRFRIGARRVASLRRGLARAHFDELESRYPLDCPDCYLYEIDYRGNDVAFGEVNVPEGLTGVLRQLEAVLAAHLPFH